MSHPTTVIKYSEIKNRAKNGAMAAAGTFAIVALTSYRTSQEMYYEPDFKKVLKVSGWFALVTGLIWALMPKAKEEPSKHVQEVKETVMTPVNVFLARVLNIQKDTNEDIDRLVRGAYSSSYSRPYESSPYWRTTSADIP